MQPPEKHQDLVRGVFQCMYHPQSTFLLFTFCIRLYVVCLICEARFAVLSARPDSVSNFVKVDAIFGPVMNPLQD